MSNHLASGIIFALCIERGDLESKSKLLVESIRYFGGFCRTSPIWLVQNKRYLDLNRNTLKFFEDRNVNLIAKRLQLTPSDLRFANKVAVGSYVEREIKNNETLVILDSDMLCINPPTQLCLKQGMAASCTVGSLGLAIEANKELDTLWLNSFNICDVKTESYWKTITRNDGKSIWAYYNSGLVASSCSSFFTNWQKFLSQLSTNTYFKSMKRPDKRYRELDQIALTLNIISLGKSNFIELPSSYNYSLRAHVKGNILLNKTEYIEEAVFVHYGNLLYNLEWMQQIKMKEETQKWLLPRLPLRVEQKGTFFETLKRLISILKS